MQLLHRIVKIVNLLKKIKNPCGIFARGFLLLYKFIFISDFYKTESHNLRIF